MKKKKRYQKYLVTIRSGDAGEDAMRPPQWIYLRREGTKISLREVGGALFFCKKSHLEEKRGNPEAIACLRLDSIFY